MYYMQLQIKPLNHYALYLDIKDFKFWKRKKKITWPQKMSFAKRNIQKKNGHLDYFIFYYSYFFNAK